MDRDPWRRPPPLRQGPGVVSGQLWPGLWSSARHSPLPVAGSPSSPAGPEAGGPGALQGEGRSPHLSTFSAARITARLPFGGPGPLTPR